MTIHGRSPKTTAPVAEAVALSVSVEPEWAKVSYITARFGIGRTIAFRNIANGVWESVLLRDKGKKSGIRLVHVASIREHLARLSNQQAAKFKAEAIK